MVSVNGFAALPSAASATGDRIWVYDKKDILLLPAMPFVSNLDFVK
jgi:hypothetical protein